MSSVQQTNTPTAPADALTAAFARWKKTVEAELKGAPFEKKLVTRTFEGVAIQPLYTRNDVQGLPDQRPGQAPFLRGTKPTGYREKRWEVAQEIAAATPVDFNTALLADLMHGQDAVILNASGASGSLPITTLKDLTAALAKADLSAIPVHITTGADPLPVAALYLAYAQKRKVAWEKLTGSVTADPLTEWVRNGHLSQDISTLQDKLAGWTQWAAQHAPHVRTIGVNGRIWGDAGANAVQELAFTLAAAAEYLTALTQRGVPVEVAAAKIRFEFAIGPQFFTEIAKFRAWRSLWTRVVVAFGAKDVVAAQAAVHAATGRWNKTLLDPHVNMLRVTTEALSAVLGGVDSLHIAPFDEVTGVTDDFSRRIARNVHTLLSEEFGFTNAADPAGGSWYVEKVTDEFARKAWELFQKVQATGGYVAALKAGMPQKLVSEAAAEKADAVGKRRLGIVGTNLFPNLKEKPFTVKTPASAAPAKSKKVALPALSATAGWPERIEALLAAATAGASVSALATLSGPSTSAAATIPAAKPFRASAEFEAMRAASEAFGKKTGKRPQVFVAKMGPTLQHKARADFSAGFFATGGFELLAKQAFENAQSAADAAVASGAPITVLCSTDDTYPELVPAFAKAVKAARPEIKIVLAGLPADQAVVDSFRAAGVDEFIHIRANVQAVLANFLKQIGALA